MIRFTHNGAVVEAPLTEHSIKNLKTIFPHDIVDSAVILSKWNSIRLKRDSLISETDWTQMPDAPLADGKKAEFVTYRQVLRDIPQNVGDPDSVVWPAKPII